MREVYGQWTFASESFGAMKKFRDSVVTVQDEEGDGSIMLLAKVSLLLRLRCGRDGEKR